MVFHSTQDETLSQTWTKAAIGKVSNISRKKLPKWESRSESQDVNGSAPSVLSLIRVLGHRSETWLYNQIVAPQRHRVHVFAYRHINKDEYPFPNVTECRTPWMRARDKMRRLMGIGTANWIPVNKPLLNNLLRRYPFHVVQAHYGLTGYRALELLGDGPLPFLVWLYGSDVFRDGPCRNEFLPRLFRSNAFFACTSYALCREALSLGCEADRIRIIYPGLDIDKIAAVQRSMDSPLRIVSIGRMVDFKNPKGLVNIAAILKMERLDFTWEVLGGGPLLRETKKAIDRAMLGDHMQLRGEVSNSVVLSSMAKADLMVHNGVVAPDGGRESFGVALVEASATGLPIISTRVGGIPEIVLDGQTGLLAEPGDAEGMARAILRLAGNRELCTKMGVAARDYVQNKFDIKIQAQQLDRYYDDLCGQGRYKSAK